MSLNRPASFPRHSGPASAPVNSPAPIAPPDNVHSAPVAQRIEQRFPKPLSGVSDHQQRPSSTTLTEVGHQPVAASTSQPATPPASFRRHWFAESAVLA